MYPRITDLLYDLFGWRSPIPLYSFGLMVAVGILLAAYTTAANFRWMHRSGILPAIAIRLRRKGQARSEHAVRPPSEVVGNLALIAAATGLVGAKLFHIWEYWDLFRARPWEMLFSPGGLTFYGGLITGALGVVWALRRYRIPIKPAADAIAPGLMLAYGVGRIGCHLAGDGDWGIPADLAAKPDWLPTWLWAETYPRAIVGPPEVPVYPTPLYEFFLCTLFFGLLWVLRRHPYRFGWLFSLYLVLNGLERFLIEQIRVNPRFSFFGWQVTQAELIALLLMLGGLVGLWRTWRRRP
ncbi:MAG: prolipoprotein diacylglyceryl transferase [Bacteroidetes bacterium]|nr:prolipoprotein diacylglyceryl transferase [Rhodothermia bacterium]MCS7155919.1 prolipoprotein diacylglyceryl transferase [Bacteroidota bacterium]MCX7905925.1 prolipoprotein diacylglyceryl transferase [Bacteroidota bacterium]MDW8138108.1 prolipoprotein diacylglyceryl transferase [Bacteroidota bacterium]MDW8285792.1 prolipoprotein diacylglyceryl transferase [Bacteroidota bacterium]